MKATPQGAAVDADEVFHIPPTSSRRVKVKITSVREGKPKIVDNEADDRDSIAAALDEIVSVVEYLVTLETEEEGAAIRRCVKEIADAACIER